MNLLSETNQQSEMSELVAVQPVWGEHAAFFSLTTCEQQELGEVTQVLWPQPVGGRGLSRAC